MRHYHGTPMGQRGKEDVLTKFLTGRNALIPFPNKNDLSVAMEVCHSVIFDSGAFTVWKQGGKLDVDGYLSWCDEWCRHPRFEWALIPDDIDGDEYANDALLREWPQHIPGVPVYHLHEDLSRIERLAKQWPIVALGSSGVWKDPGSTGWWSRMATIMDVVCDDKGRPKCKLHGLRMLDPKLFSLPLYSADSTNAARNCGNDVRWVGPYAPMTVWQRAAVIADRVEAQQSAAVWERPRQQLLFNGY